MAGGIDLRSVLAQCNPIPTAPHILKHVYLLFLTPLFLMCLFYCCSAQLTVFCSYRSIICFPGATNGENDYEPGLPDFDPVKHHNSYCPWVNGIVAAACCYDTSSSSGSSELSGWQLTVDALDTFQSLGQSQNQTMRSESAASLNMVIFVMLIFSISSSFHLFGIHHIKH